MKKFFWTAVLTVLVMYIGGCGFQTADSEEDMVSTIAVDKNGGIKSMIIEEFKESYYDLEELKSMIEETIDDYNATAGASRIELEECSLNDRSVKVVMNYSSYDAYEKYNGKTLFVGTVQEAYEAGYDLNMTLTDASGATQITKQELLNMGNAHMVIAEENIRLNCFGEILYKSADDVTVVGKKSADMKQTQGYGVIVFK